MGQRTKIYVLLYKEFVKYSLIKRLMCTSHAPLCLCLAQVNHACELRKMCVVLLIGNMLKYPCLVGSIGVAHPGTVQ